MILIHAADLHLGKTLHERELFEEQEAMLESLIAILAERQPAALLLAGDIYDRAIPPPTAIGLLDRFLSRAVEIAPDTAIVIIPGNHDSASRLSFGSELFRKAGVHVISRVADSLEPVIVTSRASGTDGRPGTRSSPGLNDRGSSDLPVPGGSMERCAIWALPFVGGAGDGAEAPRGQAMLFAAAVDAIRQKMETTTIPAAPTTSEGIAFAATTSAQTTSAATTVPIAATARSASYNVLLAHCFATGGMPSDSERAFVGLAEEVDARLFDAFDYVALGHLHRPQAAGAKGRYSGAPLAYSFGEALRLRLAPAEAGPAKGSAGPAKGSAGAAKGSGRSPDVPLFAADADAASEAKAATIGDKVERGFLLVEIGADGVHTELLPHRPLRRLVRIEATFESLCDSKAVGEYHDDLVEVCLTDSLPVLEPSELLKEVFPNLLSVRQAAFEVRLPGGRPSGEEPSGEEPGPMPIDVGGDPENPQHVIEEFSAFHREMKGEEPDEALASLFRSIVEEAVHEAY